ncbi:MAG TPA: hypothetical protein VNT99_02465 [Methylomirabilota bacterium]|nr:hypothetical protein [Methylomirabilota bacterium]
MINAFQVPPATSNQIPIYSLILLLVILAAGARAQEAKHGTAIAAIRTDNEIVVAADSRVVNADDTPDPKPLCKIRQIRNLFFSVSGMSEDPPSGFDVFRIIDNSVQAEGSFLDRITTFETSAKIPLEKALERLRVERPHIYQHNFSHMAPLGVIFFGLETNTLFLFHRRFVINSPTNQPVTVKIERRACPGSDCPGGIGHVFVGPSEDVKRFQTDNPNYWKGNLVATARKFVQMRIDTKAVSVGPPIDIIRLTRNGAEGIQRKNECPDVQQK